MFTHYVRGAAAIASLPGLPVGERARRLAEGKRAARRLDRESMAWTAPLAAIVAGSLAQACGNTARAEQSLRRAVALAKTAEMALYAAAAGHQLGSLLGGEDGDAMRNDAAETMRTCGVRVPERYAQMLVPGQWDRSARD